MTDDLLERAASALRDETAEPELRSGLTRARLLDSAAKRRRAGGLRVRWIVPFVLTLGAGSALAHVTHQHFPEVWNALVPASLEQPLAPKPEAPREPKAKKLKRPPPKPVAPIPEVPVVTPELTELAEPTTSKRVRTKRIIEPVEARAPAAPLPPVLSITPAIEAAPDAPDAPAESAELALFRRAMKLHDAKDARALAAWDDFLRVAPKSPLATEARYNRALGLVRADRSREAKAALAPFARGEHGGFRKREAAQLLQALESRDGGVAD